ncbi:MAG: SdrD B-like domain-containing protein [Phototrophicaceae bacterium]
MKRTLLVSLLVAMLIVASVVLAQTGGQFCVRSFEDRNANGVIDADESVLTRGVAVDLLNQYNIVIASALLDNSPNATDGIICFQQLPSGQYSVLVTSADYQPTTPSLVSRDITDSGFPTVVNFGGQQALTVATPTASQPSASWMDTLIPNLSAMNAEQQRSFVLRLGLSLLCGVVSVVFMVLFGFIIYWVSMRQRQPRAVQFNPASAQPIDPGSVEVNAMQTQTYPIIDEPAFQDEDTNASSSFR